MEEEARGVEPRLLKTLVEVFSRPATLVGVPREGPVVDLQPRILVCPRPEGSDGDVGTVFQGQRDAHLVEPPDLYQAQSRGIALLFRRGGSTPPTGRVVCGDCGGDAEDR